jgi:nitrite reductase/ring-hydroxylating ferredoxin subunit
MSRTIFQKIFLVVALVAVVSYGCRKNRDEVPQVDFTIDINDPNHPEYQALNSSGSVVFIPEYGIGVGRTAGGAYFAVTGQCTAHSCELAYQYPDQLKCPCSSCLFNTDGTVAMGPASISLLVYAVQQYGQQLRIYTP